jgi:hypothetical protein
MSDLVEIRWLLSQELSRLSGNHSAHALLGLIERLIDAKTDVRKTQLVSDAKER